MSTTLRLLPAVIDPLAVPPLEEALAAGLSKVVSSVMLSSARLA